MNDAAAERTAHNPMRRPAVVIIVIAGVILFLIVFGVVLRGPPAGATLRVRYYQNGSLVSEWYGRNLNDMGNDMFDFVDARTGLNVAISKTGAVVEVLAESK